MRRSAAIAALAMAFATGFTEPSAERRLPRPPPPVDQCPARSTLLEAEPVCIADVAMVAANPRPYCDQRINLIGYLDPQEGMFYSSRGVAELQVSAIAIYIEDPELVDAMASRPGERFPLANAVGQFICGSPVPGTPSIGALRDIENLVVVEAGMRTVLVDAGRYVGAPATQAARACPEVSGIRPALASGGFTGGMDADFTAFGAGGGYCFYRYEFVFGSAGRLASRLVVFRDGAYVGSYAIGFTDLKVKPRGVALEVIGGDWEEIPFDKIGSTVLVDGELESFYR